MSGVTAATKQRPGFWPRAGALLFYAAIVLVFMDRGRGLGHVIIGLDADPLQFVWFFAWWPWAIAHHLNPLYCNLIWQPLGMPMLWVTSVPLLALLAAPLTIVAGPEYAYNLFVLGAPVLAAFCAYLLCLRITGSQSGSLVGGFVFGFSGYEMAADLATINLSFVLLLPCLVLLALRRLDGEIGRFRCVLFATSLMAAQFFISTEVFATIGLFGMLTWLFALRIIPERRAALLALLIDACIAAAVTLAVLAPFLWDMAWHAHYVKLPPAWPYIFTADLLNFVIPTAQSALRTPRMAAIARHFVGGLQEEDAYLGLPLLLIVALFARERWRTRGGGFLVVLFAVFAVASLGPALRIGGRLTSVILPWWPMLHVPLLGSALPGRFALFVSLAAAVIAAIWVADGAGGWPRRFRLALGVLACIALLPAQHQRAPIPRAAFFSPGRVQAVLGQQARVLVLPFGGRGASTYWQAENRFGYAQTGGYLGYPPAAMQHFAVVEQLFDQFQLPGFLDDLQIFCAATRTQYIIAGPGTPPSLTAALAKLGWAARGVDDVVIYTVPAGAGTAHG